MSKPAAAERRRHFMKRANAHRDGGAGIYAATRHPGAALWLRLLRFCGVLAENA
jgi:hypothetical protein